MTARDYMPGVPAAGHVTSSGYWHPGRATDCPMCVSSGWGQPEPWRCDECGATGKDNGVPDACPRCGTRESCMPL